MHLGYLQIKLIYFSLRCVCRTIPGDHPNSQSPKYIVYKQCLIELLQCCVKCGLSCEVSWRVIGTFIATNQLCAHCNYSRKWYSQPMINDIPAGNLHLSASVYFTGASFAKVCHVLAALRVASISSTTFYRHVQLFLQPTILSIWTDHQKELLSCLARRSGDIILGGDMRADSPGHCAKYGSYTMMELRANRIIDVSLIQV
jgi:hypothetical protein